MSFAVLSRKSDPSAANSKAASSALRVGKADDAFEREADRIADQVLAIHPGIPAWSISGMSIGAPVQRQCDCGGAGECEECKSKRAIQRKASSEATLPIDRKSVV